MKKPFNKTKVGQFLTKKPVGKLILGAVDAVTFGAGSNIVESTEDYPSGKADIIKLIGSFLIAGYLIYLVVSGQITIEEAQELNNLSPI